MKYDNITVEYIQDWSGIKTLLRYRVGKRVLKTKMLHYNNGRYRKTLYLRLTGHVNLELPKIYHS